jgi:hypothetical protein
MSKGNKKLRHGMGPEHGAKAAEHRKAWGTKHRDKAWNREHRAWTHEARDELGALKHPGDTQSWGMGMGSG